MYKNISIAEVNSFSLEPFPEYAKVGAATVWIHNRGVNGALRKMIKLKRLSAKGLIRLLVVLVIYVVMLRLHVFRQYHMTERFHHLVADHWIAADHVIKNGSAQSWPEMNSFIADVADHVKITTRREAAVFGQSVDEENWRQEEARMVYSDAGGIVLNLDSTKWHDVNKEATIVTELVSAINQSGRFIVQCRDDITQSMVRQPVRRIFEGGRVIAVGEPDSTVSDYAVFGVGLDSFDSARVVSYLFYGPLSALAWKRIGHGTVAIIVDELEHWLASELHRHVLRHLCSVGAVMMFFPAPLKNAVMISQTSRIFSAFLLRRLLQLAGAPVDYDPYLVTADVDLWPLKSDMFASETPQNQTTPSPSISLLNHGCCAWFVHRGVRQKMYPLTYIRMRLSTWCNLIKTNANITENGTLSHDVILDVLRRDFGNVVDERVQKGQNDGWFLDQHLLSYWINQYMKVNGRELVTFGSRPGMRLDRIHWPERVSSITFEYTFDVHLPKLRSGTGWQRVLVLIELMYGAGTSEYKWSTRYKDKFVSLLPPEILTTTEE